MGAKGEGPWRRRRAALFHLFYFYASLVVAGGDPNLQVRKELAREEHGNQQESWGDVHLDVLVEAVVEEKDTNDNFNKNEQETLRFATLLLGGSKINHSAEAVSSTSFCPHGVPPFPSIRFASSGCHFSMSSSIMVCGGRENLLSLSSSCWLYTKDKDTWEEAWQLPRAVAGAATICMENRMILLGGVMEEDYYQGEDIEGGDYYDYSTEVSSSLAFEFDMRTKSWKEGLSLPEALQGGCGLAWEGRMMVTGGKNDKNCSYGTDRVFMWDETIGSWTDGPRMNHPRFYHGCIIMEIAGQKGLVVAGGIGLGSYGDSVEFLPIFRDELAHAWTALPKLSFPHPNLPTLGQLGGRLFVHGGGGFPYPGGEDKTEVLLDGVWRSMSGLGVIRSFGLGIPIPEHWMETCLMEPNFGVHPYYRKQGQSGLDKHFWFCQGEKLKVPFHSNDEDYPSGCTVPGCQFSQVPQHLMRSGTFGCKVQNTSQVLCKISCKKGYRPWGGEHSSVCTRSGGWGRNRFLECYKEGEELN